MIIFKIIGVLLLIILVLLIAAICIPVCVGIKYDTTVTLEIKYFFVSFRREFGGEEPAEFENDRAVKEITVFDKILSTVSKLIKKSWNSIKNFCSGAADFIKRGLRETQKMMRSKFKLKTKAKEKRKNTSGRKTSKTKSTDQSLLDSLYEERGFWGAVGFFVDIGKTLGGGLVKIYRGMAANRFVLRVKIVGEDAADTAIKYGKICSAAFPALSFLLSNMRRYSQDIEITPDFDGDEGSIYFDGEFKLFPILIIGHALGAVIKFAWQQIKITFNNKKRKADVKI